MLLKIWNYFRGYVTIEVTGFSVERFINLAANRGVYIWDIAPNGAKISMNMSIKGYKSLKGCTKKTRCKMRIASKNGLPFLFFKYRKRKVFAFGLLFFVAALYILSSFVWVVEINGNERISTNAVLSYCEEAGLMPGALKYTLDTKKIANGFMAAFDDLSWIAIEINGTKVKINIAETIDKPKVIDKTTPCDIIASSDGLITDMVVVSGTPLVKVKDTVQKGDVLVSGMLTIKDGEEIKGYRYTHATAEVTAKTRRDINIYDDLIYIRKDYTGKTKKLYAVNFLGEKFIAINTGISYKNYDRITKIKPLGLGGDFALPVSLEVTECSEYTPVLLERTFEEAKTRLSEKLDRMLEDMLQSDEIIIVDRSVSYEQKDGKAHLNAVITVEMRIDEQSEPKAEIPEDETISSQETENS